MLELNGDLGAVLVAAVDDLAVALDRIVGEEAGLSGAALGLLIDHGGLQGDKAEAPFCPGLVVGKGARAEGTVSVGQVVAHGRDHKAVGDGD